MKRIGLLAIIVLGAAGIAVFSAGIVLLLLIAFTPGNANGGVPEIPF